MGRATSKGNVKRSQRWNTHAEIRTQVVWSVSQRRMDWSYYSFLVLVFDDGDSHHHCPATAQIIVYSRPLIVRKFADGNEMMNSRIHEIIDPTPHPTWDKRWTRIWVCPYRGNTRLLAEAKLKAFTVSLANMALIGCLFGRRAFSI